MEAHGVLPCDDRWRGIVADYAEDGSYGNHFPGTVVFYQALMQRNTNMLQYMLPTRNSAWTLFQRWSVKKVPRLFCSH